MVKLFSKLKPVLVPFFGEKGKEVVDSINQYLKEKGLSSPEESEEFEESEEGVRSGRKSPPSRCLIS